MKRDIFRLNYCEKLRRLRLSCDPKKRKIVCIRKISHFVKAVNFPFVLTLAKATILHAPDRRIKKVNETLACKDVLKVFASV